jgi:hypothetical protein
MINDDHLYLDRPQLAARGWTRTLMERFLQSPDRWATVDHWKNYTGKATYFIEKVIAAEQLAEFKMAFQVSIVRRKLTQREVRAAMKERARVDADYREWIKTVGPQDVEIMILIDELAAEFEAARAMGYRTPHK